MLAQVVRAYTLIHCIMLFLAENLPIFASVFDKIRQKT
jgi:hypothetical protein